MENDEESTDTASNVDVTGCESNADGKAEYDENQNNDNSNDKMTTMIEIWWLKQIVVIKEDEMRKEMITMMKEMITVMNEMITVMKDMITVMKEMIK